MEAKSLLYLPLCKSQKNQSRTLMYNYIHEQVPNFTTLYFFFLYEKDLTTYQSSVHSEKYYREMMAQQMLLKKLHVIFFYILIPTFLFGKLEDSQIGCALPVDNRFQGVRIPVLPLLFLEVRQAEALNISPSLIQPLCHQNLTVALEI